MKVLSEVEVLVAKFKAEKKLAILKKAAYEAKFKDDIAKNRTMAWSKLHKNTRLQAMTFTDLPYLHDLYMLIGRTPFMVVEKSVQCFPGDTPILTKTGFKYIEDIQAGDYVLTHRGRFKRVIHTFKRKVCESLIQLRSDVGERVRSTKKHPFRVYPYVGGKYHYSKFSKVFKPDNAVWTNSSDIGVGDFVLRAYFPITSSLDFVYLSKYIKVFEKREGLVRCKNSRAFQDDRIELTADVGKLIGYFIAEGWIRKTRISFGFHINESDFVGEVRRILSSVLRNKVVKIYESSSDNCVRVKVCSGEWGQFLKKVCGVSANTKRIPEFAFSANPEFLKGLLVGLFNGDGYYAVQTTYTTVSRGLAIQVQILLSMFKISAVIRKDDRVKHKQVVYKVVLNGADNQRLLRLLGRSVSGRSYTHTVDLGIHRACRVKEHIETKFNGYVYNFGVEEDESYVADGYVVHNCGLSELFIIQSHIEAGELGMTVMYVLPKYELRNRFVNNRIYKLHKKVGIYRALVLAAGTKVHRTSLMHFGKGSLAYVGSNVQDEFIEIPVDSAYIDEKDHCNQANLLMLPDRLTASPYKYEREIGNPTIEGFGIDERYLDSSQGEWKLLCPECGKWFVPDFFMHVVEEISTNTFIPRDKKANPDPRSRGEIRLIHDCGAVVDRLQWGKWVHKYPDREWQGFRVSQIFSKFVSLRKLYRTWIKAVGNELKTQLFYNSNLGLPFSSRGSKITRAMLNDCRRKYEWPTRRVGQEKARLMGVDVGEYLHVILRERVKTSNGFTLKLLGIWTLPGFTQLEQLLREWKPKCCVIDSMPEIHKVMDLKEEFSNVWSSRFQEGVGTMVKHKDKRELRMDRTALLDYVRQGFELQSILLPMQGEFLEDGEYYKHMQASTRILEPNELHPEKSRFIWKEGSRPDHFFLAEGYCMQAGMIMPEHGLFDFFEQETTAMQTHGDRRQVPAPDLTDEQRDKIAEMQHLTPEVFLNKTFKDLVNVNPPKPPVNDQKIGDVIKFQHSSQGYVDVALTATMAGELEEDIRRVLIDLDFKESRISGQFIKK